MANLQGWILVFHILGIVFWIGSLLIVTRLMAVHAGASSPEVRETLSNFEGKLFNGAAHPGGLITILSGLLMFSINPEYYGHAVWMQIKLSLVLVMIILDVIAFVSYRRLRVVGTSLTRGRFMALHGIASLVFIGILIMVLVRPFGG
jgi:protoporphyrinogen IX oxidase